MSEVAIDSDVRLPRADTRDGESAKQEIIIRWLHRDGLISEVVPLHERSTGLYGIEEYWPCASEESKLAPFTPVLAAEELNLERGGPTHASLIRERTYGEHDGS